MASFPIVKGVHGSGYTRLTFSKDGKKIYTGGEDCLVRIWNASLGTDQEPKAAAEAAEAVTALACTRDGWVSGSADAYVRQYSTDTDEMAGMITRANAVPVRCLAYSPKGDVLAVGSDELSVKVIDVEDTTKCSNLTGHTAGLRAATWHPSGGHLTTSGQDGKIIVWNCQQAEIKLEKVLEGLIPTAADPSDEAFMFESAAVWHPGGAYFVVASKSHDITIVHQGSWSKSGTFAASGHSSDITALAFSGNGKYLASAGKDGQVIVWETETKKALFRHKPEGKPIVSIAFSPAANLLAWTNLDGDLGRWQNPIPSSHSSPFAVSSSSTHKTVPKEKKGGGGKTAAELEALFGEDEDADMGESTDPKPEDDAEEEEDWIENDAPDEYEGVPKEVSLGGMREMVNVTKAQPAFQPGSTPFRNKKRYLAFNHIGVIDVSDQDIHHVVNVEFHDKSLRRGYHFQDVHHFSMASLGERGIVYAAPAENKLQAIVSYRPFDSWASNGDWEISLPPGENPVCVATGGAPYQKYMDKNDISGNGNVAVATTKGYVRFLSGGGSQRYIWNIGGEVVAMAAGQEWAFIVHRESGTSLDGCQDLHYSLITFDGFDLVQQGALPLPRGTTLEWMGITHEGAPVIYDSTGLISVLDRFRRPTQGRWVPALDTTTMARRVNKEESYWAVGLSGKEFQCIILKGGEKFPGFPRPMIQELDVHMPLLGMDATQGQVEEKFLRESIQVTMLRDAYGNTSATKADIAKRELVLDKELIQLVQAACKADKLQRALDAVRVLHHAPSYDMAQKVAEFYHLVGLQEKMRLLKDLKVKRDNGDDDDEEDNNPRKNWGKVTEPIRRGGPPGYDAGRNGSSGAGRYEEFAPPPSMTRRTLAPAIPVGEVAFARPAPPPTTARGTRNVIPDAPADVSVFSEDTSIDMDSSFAFSDMDVGKRKRADDEDEDAGVVKKKAVNPNATMNVSKLPSGASASGNPFARKPGAEKPTNPFARGLKNSKSLVKSNSFFDKVDAFEAGAPMKKGKAKESAGKARQTTLLNLLPTTGDRKFKADKKAKGKAKESSVETEEPETAEDRAEETPPLADEADTQLEDTQIEETEPSEREESPEWDVDMEDEEAAGDEATEQEAVVA